MSAGMCVCVHGIGFHDAIMVNNYELLQMLNRERVVSKLLCMVILSGYGENP